MTSEDESSRFAQSVEPIISYIGYQQSNCMAYTGKTYVKDTSTGCYVPDTNAYIYCDYNDMLQTGSGCFGSPSWHDHPCSYTDSMYYPCEVDYQVMANKGSTGIEICKGASSARSKQNGIYTGGPTTLPAGQYNLNVSYQGILEYKSVGASQGAGFVSTGTMMPLYWVPDVLLVIDQQSANNFKCFNIEKAQATNTSCEIPSSVNVNAEVTNTGLMSWVESTGYSNNNKTVNCPNYGNNAAYTFEGGKSYYIRVGNSASHTSDHNCTQHYGCGWLQN